MSMVLQDALGGKGGRESGSHALTAGLHGGERQLSVRPGRRPGLGEHHVGVAARTDDAGLWVGEGIDVGVAARTDDAGLWVGEGIHVGVAARTDGAAGVAPDERVNVGVTAGCCVAACQRSFSRPGSGGATPWIGWISVLGYHGISY